MHFFTVITRQH